MSALPLVFTEIDFDITAIFISPFQVVSQNCLHNISFSLPYLLDYSSTCLLVFLFTYHSLPFMDDIISILLLQRIHGILQAPRFVVIHIP
jgi:hypothetical protein